MTNTTTVYLVSAYHPVPKYSFTDTAVTVHGRHDGFYATHPELGCGKTRDTAMAAIRQLFSDHACQLLAIRQA